jgi:hypothetical protein
MVVLCEQPPHWVAEAEWVPTKASTLVEHEAHHARRHPAACAIGVDRCVEDGRTKGRARDLQLHEEEGPTVDEA